MTAHARNPAMVQMLSHTDVALAFRSATALARRECLNEEPSFKVFPVLIVSSGAGEKLFIGGGDGCEPGLFFKFEFGEHEHDGVQFERIRTEHMLGHYLESRNCSAETLLSAIQSFRSDCT